MMPVPGYLGAIAAKRSCLPDGAVHDHNCAGRDHTRCSEARIGDCICAPHDDGLGHSLAPLQFGTPRSRARTNLVSRVTTGLYWRAPLRASRMRSAPLTGLSPEENAASHATIGGSGRFVYPAGLEEAVCILNRSSTAATWGERDLSSQRVPGKRQRIRTCVRRVVFTGDRRLPLIRQQQTR